MAERTSVQKTTRWQQRTKRYENRRRKIIFEKNQLLLISIHFLFIPKKIVISSRSLKSGIIPAKKMHFKSRTVRARRIDHSKSRKSIFRLARLLLQQSRSFPFFLSRLIKRIFWKIFTCPPRVYSQRSSASAEQRESGALSLPVQISFSREF